MYLLTIYHILYLFINNSYSYILYNTIHIFYSHILLINKYEIKLVYSVFELKSWEGKGFLIKNDVAEIKFLH